MPLLLVLHLLFCTCHFNNTKVNCFSRKILIWVIFLTLYEKVPNLATAIVMREQMYPINVPGVQGHIVAVSVYGSRIHDSSNRQPPLE